MKKNTVYLLSAMFLTVGILSCKKNTKGKLANEWKVTSSEEAIKSQFVNGNFLIYNNSMDETTVQVTSIHESLGSVTSSSTQSGPVNTNELIIKRNGDWSWTTDIAYSNSTSGRARRTMYKGTWNFFEKEGETGSENKHICLNVLQSAESSQRFENGILISDDNYENTYEEGQQKIFYVIRNLNRNKLELELEDAYVGNPHLEYHTQKITLEKK